MRAATFGAQSFGVVATVVTREQIAATNAAIVEHWRARIASGQLSPAQIKVAEAIIVSELGGGK